ncbi:hypothetical protein MKX01_030263 [Papaver californicum]|nr:hypothetical protein MKX01_030263 [Papaver californicum]
MKLKLLSHIFLLFTTKTSTASLLLAFAFISLAISVQFSAGVKYYVLPVARGMGDGLALGKQLNGTQCPLHVVQAQCEIANGLPLTFTPVDPKAQVIHVSSDLNVKFSASSICFQSMVWRLADFDESASKWFIAANGVAGNPGPQLGIGLRLRKMVLLRILISLCIFGLAL